MDDQWVQVLLGDVRVGDIVRTKAGAVADASRFSDVTGTVVGIRFGSVSMRTGQDTVVFSPDQLERLTRPE